MSKAQGPGHSPHRPMSVISRCAKLVSGERTHTKDIFRCHLVFFDEIWITKAVGTSSIVFRYVETRLIYEWAGQRPQQHRRSWGPPCVHGEGGDVE